MPKRTKPAPKTPDTGREQTLLYQLIAELEHRAQGASYFMYPWPQPSPPGPSYGPLLATQFGPPMNPTHPAAAIALWQVAQELKETNRRLWQAAPPQPAVRTKRKSKR